MRASWCIALLLALGAAPALGQGARPALDAPRSADAATGIPVSADPAATVSAVAASRHASVGPSDVVPVPPTLLAPTPLDRLDRPGRVVAPRFAASAAAGVQAASRHSVLHVALYALGGALVGGWAGYVASQVAWSDWRDEPGRSVERVRFSVAGGVLGMLAGVWLGERRTRAGPTPLPAPGPPGAPGSATTSATLADTAGIRAADGPITQQEIRASSARSISELLRELRPQWLRSRGVGVLRPSADPLEARGVRVYLNGTLLGGLDSLDQVSIDAVTGIRFVDAAVAVMRWGAGNEDGAIALTTRATP